MTHVAPTQQLRNVMARTATSRRGQPPLNLLHVGTAIPSACVLLSIAQAEGFFEARGLRVRPVLVGRTRVPELTDENPVGLIGAPAALLRSAGGSDLRILSSFTTARICGQLVASPAIATPADLRGKRVGVRAIGAGNWIQTLLALQHLGLDARRDNIIFEEVGDEVAIARSLAAGTIDVALLSALRLAGLKAKGFSVLLDLFPARLYGFPSVLAAKTSYLMQSPGIAAKLVEALADCSAFASAARHKPAVIRAIAKDLCAGGVDAVEEGYREFLLTTRRKTSPSVTQLLAMQGKMRSLAGNSLDVNVRALIDDRFHKPDGKTPSCRVKGHKLDRINTKV